MFRKKNYEGNIEQLNQCRIAAQKIEQKIEMKTFSVDKKDTEAKDVLKRFERAVRCFEELCDTHVELQMLLKRKAMKEKIGFFEYRALFDKMNQKRQEANSALHDLDIVYTDYTEKYDYYGEGAEQ